MSKNPAPKKRQLRVANKSESGGHTVTEPTASISLLQRVGIGRALRPITRPLAAIGRRIVPPYFRTSWHEPRQVPWPNHKQTRQLTSAVIIFAVVFGVLVAVFDYGLDKLF